jgi:hypothetical protein
MTLRQLINWAEKQGIDDESPLLAFVKDSRQLVDIDTVCINGNAVQLNVRSEVDEGIILALEDEHGPEEARRIWSTHCGAAIEDQ